MSYSDQLRQTYGRLLMYRCSVNHEFRQLFNVFDKDGARVAVPMLEDDSVFMACRLVAQAGGAGTLAILHAPSHAEDGTDALIQTIATMRVQSSEAPSDSTGGVPVGRTLTLRDLCGVLTEGVSITMQIAQDELSIDDINSSPVQRGDLELDQLCLVNM